MRMTFAILTFVLAFMPSAGAQTPDEVAGWISRESDLSGTPPAIDGYSIQWISESGPRTETEIREMERSASERAGRPVSLPALRSPLHRQLWSAGAGHWRVNIDLSQSQYADYCITPEHSWKLTPVALQVLGPDGVIPNHPSIIENEQYFLQELSLLLNGGFWYAKQAGLRFGAVHVDGTRWQVEAALVGPGGAPAASVEYAGVWDSSHSRGFVETFRIASSVQRPGAVGETWKITGWHHSPEIDAWIAKRAVKVTSGGRVDRIIRLHGLEAWPPGGLAAVTAIPSEHVVDFARGPLPFKRIYDHQAGTVTSLTETGTVLTPMPKDPHRSAWRRPLGWVTAALLVIGLVALRLRKSASPHS